MGGQTSKYLAPDETKKYKAGRLLIDPNQL
jgi:hypothetical protein